MNRAVLLVLLGIFMISFVGSVAAVAPPQIAIYDDPACTVLTTGIVWGTLTNATIYQRVLYVRNLASQDITAFYVSMANTEPHDLSNDLTLTCPYSVADLPLRQQYSMKLTLDLSVNSRNASLTTFNFDVVITAEYGASVSGGSNGFGGSETYMIHTAPVQQNNPAPSNNWGIGILLVGVALVVFLRTGGGRRHR